MELINGKELAKKIREELKIEVNITIKTLFLGLTKVAYN